MCERKAPKTSKPRFQADGVLTDDAVEDLSQSFKVFQDEQVLLTALLRRQVIELVFLHLVPDTEHVHI